MNTKITREDIEEKKKKLRIEWKEKPWKREIILKQVKLLEYASLSKPLV